MSNLFKSVVFVIALTYFEVTGMDFTLNKERVLLGSTGTLTMRCDITETDVDTIYLIQIQRLKSTTLSGSNYNDWLTLALIGAGANEKPTLGKDIQAEAGFKDYVAGGSWDSTTPANTYLTLSMNMEKLVCDDVTYYRCVLSYKSSTTGTVTVAELNSTFSAYVKPQVTSLVARKNGFIVQGMSPSDMATAEVGDELELTCTPNIGSLPGTIIRWHRTSETSQNNDFIGYQAPQGTYDEGTAVSENQCGYIRVATIGYNTTAADANRDNNLTFECYVTVNGDPYGNSYTSENNPRFYTDVTGSSGEQTDISITTTAKAGDGMTTNTMITTDKNKKCVAVGVIAAIVISSLTVGVLIGVALTWVYLRRNQIIKGRTDQNQHQTTTISRETELNVASSSTQSQYESLNQGAGTSHTYADLKYDR